MLRVILLSVSLLTISSVVHGSPAPRVMSVHERRDTAPSNFVRSGEADPQDSLDFRIGLTPKDTAGLEKALYAVSEPDSDLYGQHLSFEEVKAFSAPTPQAATAVTAWLAENGITDVKHGGAFDDWLTFTAPVDKANTLLNAQYEHFVHIDTGELLIRTLAASIPSDLTDFIEVVHPMTSFATPASGPKAVVSIPLTSNLTERANPAPLSCDNAVTPACLQGLYGIPSVPATQSSNKLAVSGFINQFAQTADLQAFLAAFRPDIPPTTTFTFQSVDSGVNIQDPNEAGDEANLDIQYTVGVATGVPTVFISVGNRYLDIIDFLNGEANPPQVLTTSYGFDETGISSSIATRLCNAYAGLGARGVSILFGSGDGGVSGLATFNCTTFVPTFPAGCPYITSVGATKGVTETAAGLSAGGFSNIFARPSYQASAVSAYLTSLGNTHAGKFNTSGRGYPDVSAPGVDVQIVSGGQTSPVSGTSCSSPIFASVISLINDRLIAAGKPVLGFLNPFLYANPDALFDITTGSNPGCGTSGFPAGADCKWMQFVTGLGTPNFTALLKAAGV
ncbi:family S53 protease-like protein [Armillaria novae-zelandiae]|uniref:Family S53 protease-like protein n=1 Tax=Armillaria novae-zelandiae TaxID=153914 RepID=A0AA39PD95_9AGAR|nr:family S53 protease-like protein [Armillaria novae-zelandiae]